MHLTRKEAKRLGLIDSDGNATSRVRPSEQGGARRSAPQSRIDSNAHKSRLTKPQRKMSYKAACESGWQFSYHNIGGGNVACRATNRRLGKQTAWLTDDTDGRGAVLAALGEGEKG